MRTVIRFLTRTASGPLREPCPLGMDPTDGVAAAELAKVYLGSVTGRATGQVLEVPSV